MTDANDANVKTALVTGASRGIGAAIFAALAAEGGRVFGTATGEAGLAAINAAGGAGAGLLYDARDAEAGGRLVEEVTATAGGVDVLVVNAAVNADGLLMRMKGEDWARVIETNLTGAFLLSQAALRGMVKRRWGRIVFVTSVVASVGNAGQANYCAAKAGVEGYCRAAAREVAGRGITVNAVAPGFIETDMTAKLPAAVKEYFMKNIPVGRVGQPRDVAAAVAFLASEAAAYVTGQTLHVNGGMYCG